MQNDHRSYFFCNEIVYDEVYSEVIEFLENIDTRRFCC